MRRVAQPPPSLRVEATVDQTMVLLDHGRPMSAIKPWRRTAGIVFVLSLAVAWFLPVLLCPLSLPVALVFLAVVGVDLSRTVNVALVLRKEHLCIVTRDLVSLRRCRIPWNAITEVRLDASGRRRNRDVVLVLWTVDDTPRTARLGMGRDVEDLIWIKTMLLKVVEMICPESPALQPQRALPVPIDSPLDDVAAEPIVAEVVRVADGEGS